MSCLDVMYQSTYHHQPYQPYSFYQRHFSHQKFGHYSSKTHEETPVDYSTSHHTQSTPSPLTHNRHHHPYHHTSSSSSTAPHTATSPTDLVQNSTVKEENRTSPTGDDKDSHPSDTKYYNSKCVVYTFYTGEVNKVVDDHFSRALSQPSSFTTNGVKKCTATGSPQTWSNKETEGDSVPPMCQRNFPPSFWNSNYVNNNTTSGYPTSNSFSHGVHHDSLFGDSYSTSLHHHRSAAAAAASAATDHWHYPFGSSQSSYTHHRSIHDLSSYGMSTSSAFNPRYSSLLIQPPTVRPGRLSTIPGQCDFSKSASDWSTTYSTHAGSSSTTQPQSYGIETASTSALDAQDTSKDLYWF